MTSVTDTTADLQSRLQAALGPHYRLERSLGQGGMGVVFLARDLTLDRQVAVKVVHPELAVHSSITQRFLAEARVIARLRHPNIVAIHAAGETTGLFWYVMDFVPGETLRERLNREGRIAPGIAARLVAELADALDAAGRQGVVHRDVKPENILLDAESGRALLADFGIARVLAGAGAGDRPITGQGVAVGTPTYMSPEQALGDEVDHRSDLYSLGVVAYEMLTGRPPFRGSPQQVAAQQIRAEPAPLERACPEAPPSLSRAVLHALAKAPADRFATGAEFRDAVRGGALPAARSRRRGWWGWAAAALTLVAAGLGALLLGRGDRPPSGVDPRHSIVVLPFDNLRGDTTLRWLEEGSVSMLGLTMAQWEDLTVVDQERVHDLLAKRGLEPGAPIGLEAARAIAREAGVWSLVVGDFVRSGDSLHVTARLIDVASGQRVDLAQSDALALGDVRPAFDRLAAQLLDVSGAPGGVRPGLAAATTGSVDAYRDYLSGIEALNKWSLASADSALRRAVSRDPTFALAWYKLAVTRGWVGGAADSVGRHAVDEASRYAARLPVREQTLVRAYRAFVDGDFPRAVELYAALVRKDSTDADAWYGLGDAWFHRPVATAEERARAMTASLRAFRRTLRIDPTYMLAYDHVATMFSQNARARPAFAVTAADSFVPAAGLAPAALTPAVARARQQGITLARDWVSAQPETPRAERALFEAYAAAGQLADADRELERLMAMGAPADPSVARLLAGRARFGAGDLAAALSTLRPVYDTLARDRRRMAAAADADASTLFGGLNALAYAGDIGRAARVLREAASAHPPTEAPRDAVVDPRFVAELHAGALYAGAGGAAPPLREIWRTVAEAARRAPSDRRAAIARAGTPAAVGLLLGPARDPTPLAELRSLTGEAPPSDIEALLDLARGDSAAARTILAHPAEEVSKERRPAMSGWAGFPYPLRAYALLLLGEPHRALALLDDHGPEMLDPAMFSTAWGSVGMVRMLRGMAYEQLDRRTEAAREYRAALTQWDGADPREVPYLDQVRLALGRVTGTG
jgi:serine/threonine-protein kinase